MSSVSKFAIVGCGSISLKHVQAIENTGGSISAFCDVSEQRAKSLAEHSKAGSKAQIYKDFRKLIDLEEPGIAAIATDSATHTAISIEFLRKNWHVVVEKPVALSSRDLSDAIAHDAGNRRATVAYVLRFMPHLLLLKQASTTGRFGRILHASISVHWNRNAGYYEQARWRGTWERDGGALMNQCTHGIDMLQWIIGSEPRRVSGAIRRYLRPIEAEDFGTATVEFDSGAVGTIVGSVDVYPTNHDETLSVFGEKGTVVIGGKALNEVLTWSFDDETGNELEHIRDVARNGAGNSVGHHALYSDFIDAIRTGQPPLVTLKDAARSVEIVLAIYQSAKEERAIELPSEFATVDMAGYFD